LAQVVSSVRLYSGSVQIGQCKMAAGWRPVKHLLVTVILQALALVAKSYAVPDSKACIGQVREFDVCPDLPECVERIPCTFAPWDEWRYEADCVGLCFRERQVKEYNNKYGVACSGPTKISKDCTDKSEYISECSAGLPTRTGRVDCVWSKWSMWSGCTRQCGGGEQRRDRHILGEPEHGGAPCSPEVMEEVRPCNTQLCDECVDGRWSDWGKWGPCSASCGAGLQQRQRDISVPENNCGRPIIGSANEFRPCHTVDCTEASTRCSLSDWGQWGACSASCGMGKRARDRSLKGRLPQDTYTKELEQTIWKLQEDSSNLELKGAALRENITYLEEQVSALLDEKKIAASAAADDAVDAAAVIASLKEKLRAANSGEKMPSPSTTTRSQQRFVYGEEAQREGGISRFDDSEELRTQTTRNRAVLGGFCLLIGVPAFYFWYGERNRNRGTVLGSAPDVARSSGPDGAMALQGARPGLE